MRPTLREVRQEILALEQNSRTAIEAMHWVGLKKHYEDILHTGTKHIHSHLNANLCFANIAC